MKSLNEYLVLELKADTYKSAYQKARAKGDDRADKFLAAYIKALQEETPEADELAKKITSWAKEDKQQILKIKKSSDNGGKIGNAGFYFFVNDDTKNPNYRYDDYEKAARFYLAKKDNDIFFYRFNKDLFITLKNYLPNGVFDRVFSDKYAKGNEDKKFAIIDAIGEHHNWYIYFLDDKKLIYVDSKIRTEEKDVTEFVKKKINELGF